MSRCERRVGANCPNPATLIGLPWPTPLCVECAKDWCDGPDPFGQKRVRPMTVEEQKAR